MVVIVIDYVIDDMKIYWEESFGFVVVIIRVKDEVDVICIVNDSEYGFSVVVFIKDSVRGLRVV